MLLYQTTYLGDCSTSTSVAGSSGFWHRSSCSKVLQTAITWSLTQRLLPGSTHCPCSRTTRGAAGSPFWLQHPCLLLKPCFTIDCPANFETSVFAESKPTRSYCRGSLQNCCHNITNFNLFVLSCPPTTQDLRGGTRKNTCCSNRNQKCGCVRCSDLIVWEQKKFYFALL